MRAFSLWISQCPNNISQSQKAAVNLDTLFQSLSSVSRPQDALRPCQVDKVELGRQHLWSSVCGVPVQARASPTLIHVYGENGVRAAGVRIHLRCSGMSGCVS